MMKRLLATAALVCLTMVTVSTAQADSVLEDAFTDFSATTSKAGLFKSQVRNTLSGGSGEVRFGHTPPMSPIGINITPPSVSVGCSGIDWHLGGFSWVNSAKIKQMLQGVIQGAEMYVISMAISTLCEQCQAQINSVLDTIRQVASKEMDSCQMGKQLAESGIKAASSYYCQNQKADSNATSGYSESRLGCNPNKAAYSLSDSGWFQSAKAGIDKVAAKCSGGLLACFHDFDQSNESATGATQEQQDNQISIGQVNLVWQQLKDRGLIMDPHDFEQMRAAGSTKTQMRQRADVGYALGELVMSMVGTTVPNKKGNGVKPVYPTLDSSSKVNAAVGVVMCGEGFFTGKFDSDLYSKTTAGGSLTAQNKQTISNICGQMFGGSGQGNGAPSNRASEANVSIITCMGNPSNGTPILQLLEQKSPADSNAEVQSSYSNCLPLSKDRKSYSLNKIGIKQWFGLSYVKDSIGIGTLALSIGTMNDIIEKIDCSNTSTNCRDETFTPQEIGFIENAPFPLYELLNQAAVFPSMRQVILTKFGKIIGMMMARQFILNYFQNSGNFALVSKDEQTSKFLTEEDEKISRSLTELTNDIKGSLDEIRTSFQRAQIIREYILQTEQSLRDSVFARNLMGNERFTMDISTPQKANDNPNSSLP